MQPPVKPARVLLPCPFSQQKTPAFLPGFCIGGEGGIRTLDTLLTYTHFPGVRLQPLGHLSKTLCSCLLLSRGTCFASGLSRRARYSALRASPLRGRRRVAPTFSRPFRPWCQPLGHLSKTLSNQQPCRSFEGANFNGFRAVWQLPHGKNLPTAGFGPIVVGFTELTEEPGI